MGRLFWKFFLSILLAQVTATIAIGGAFWLRDQARQRAVPVLESGPPAAIALDAAQATLRHGGLMALRGLLGDMRRPQVYVVDAARHDLLGRPVPAELLAAAERDLRGNGQTEALPKAQPKAEPNPQPVTDWRGTRRLTGPDGAHYIAFVSRQSGRMDGMRGGGRPDPLEPGLDPAARRRVGQTVAIGAAVLASLLFAALLAWYFSRPIRALRSAFEAAAAGDLAPRFGPGPARRGGDELNDLGRDFDRMSARLRALMDGQRRLLHDVSHELRSPLARMQAAVGLAHQQPDKIATTLERIERESNRMDKLVGELLTLSRLEASPDVLRRESVDLVELLDGIVLDARFEASQASQAGQPPVEILFEAAGHVVVSGDPDLLWSALENVVRNAARHGAAGGIVSVEVAAMDGIARVDVLDRGPGIPAFDLAEVFRPFFRAGAAQGSVDGHGLGLAIAQRVAHAHGGQIAAANRADGGLRVTFTLPCT